LAAEIFVSFYGALFLQSVRSEDKRRVMELAQVDFRARAEQYGDPGELPSIHASTTSGASWPKENWCWC
jgi:hypothetical protein